MSRRYRRFLTISRSRESLGGQVRDSSLPDIACEQRRDRVSYESCDLLLRPREREPIGEGLKPGPFTQSDVPVTLRMGEAPAREAVETRRDRGRRKAAVEATVHTSMPDPVG